MRARGDRNLILCFLYTPNRCLSHFAWPPLPFRALRSPSLCLTPPLCPFLFLSARIFRLRPRRNGGDNAGVEEISPRFSSLVATPFQRIDRGYQPRLLSESRSGFFFLLLLFLSSRRVSHKMAFTSKHPSIFERQVYSKMGS